MWCTDPDATRAAAPLRGCRDRAWVVDRHHDPDPATFQANFALLETAGDSATIRVTVRYSAVAGGSVAAKIEGSKDDSLGPHQFLPLGSVAREVPGPGRDAHGDLRNLQIEFAHVGGNGTVEAFLSSVDNRTGDSILRME